MKTDRSNARNGLELWKLGFFLVLISASALASGLETDGPGNVRVIDLKGARVPITTDIQMPSRNWVNIARTGDPWRVDDVQFQETSGQQRWTGRAWSDGGIAFAYQQTIRREGESIRLSAQVTSQTSAPLEGLYLFVRVPVSLFAGGQAQLTSAGLATGHTLLPVQFPGAPHFLFTSADRALVSDAAGRIQLEILLDRSLSAVVQDNRQWEDEAYALLFHFHQGSLTAGQSASVDLTLKLTGEPDTSSVNLSVDPGEPGSLFEGWGGNYVFCLEGEEIDFSLEHLRVAWARTQMSLDQWEPANDNDSPDQSDWSFLESQVRPGSPLEQEFLLAQKLEALGIPRIVSIWRLPRWLQPQPKTEVDPQLWPELVESITSYLIFARDHFGTQPQYFSFNEPDLGVDVLFSAEEHGKWIQTLGRRLQSLGLKTQMLLGDTASASAAAYALQAAEDPAVLDYVGAVAFHSWNGARAEEYRQWNDFSRTIGKPLFVTEVGSDPSAWRFPRLIQTYGYALDDLANEMQFLIHARPQAALQWEFTCDYSLLGGSGESVPSQRFWLVKHLADLTPPGSEALSTRSSNPDVLLAAFRSSRQRPWQYVFHVANLGLGRKATLSGLPARLSQLQPVRTTQTESLLELPKIPVENGRATLLLEPQSLLTLTGSAQPGWKRRR
ncbi:MAG: hypothetical protein ACE5JX_04660 [Acidobacteriota bacterium]